MSTSGNVRLPVLLVSTQNMYNSPHVLDLAPKHLSILQKAGVRILGFLMHHETNSKLIPLHRKSLASVGQFIIQYLSS